MATALGPSLYGAFGALVIIQQLLGYAVLGMREGVVIDLAQRPKDASNKLETYSSSLAFVGFIGFLLPVLAVVFDIVIQGALNINHLLCALIGAFAVINDLLINLNRYEGNLQQVTLCETSYNLISFIVIFLLRDILTVEIAQGVILVALIVSVNLYGFRQKFFSARSISVLVIKRLLGTGGFTAMLSAVMLFSNGMFVLLAGRHLSEVEAGQYTFANNIASILMVSINAFSWAMTSRTMGAIASTSDDLQSWDRVVRIDVLHRVSVALINLGAICFSIIMPLVVERYAESSRYVLLIVSLQSLQLIAVTEQNFLILKGKSWAIAAIFCLAVSMNIGVFELFQWSLSFETKIIISLFIMSFTTLGVIRYAVLLGFKGSSFSGKLVAITGLMVTTVFYSILDAYIALVCAVLFGVNIIVCNWQLLRHRSAFT